MKTDNADLYKKYKLIYEANEDNVSDDDILAGMDVADKAIEDHKRQAIVEWYYEFADSMSDRSYDAINHMRYLIEDFVSTDPAIKQKWDEYIYKTAQETYDDHRDDENENDEPE
jgi:hypothetical protein